MRTAVLLCAAFLAAGRAGAQVAGAKAAGDPAAQVARASAARAARLPEKAGAWSLRFAMLAVTDPRRHFLYGSGKKLASVFVAKAANSILRAEKGWSAVALSPVISGYVYTDPAHQETMVVWLQYGQRRTAAARLAPSDVLSLAHALAVR